MLSDRQKTASQPGMVVHNINPSTWKTKATGSLRPGQSTKQISEQPKLNTETLSKQKGKKGSMHIKFSQRSYQSTPALRQKEGVQAFNEPSKKKRLTALRYD